MWEIDLISHLWCLTHFGNLIKLFCANNIAINIADKIKIKITEKQDKIYVSSIFDFK